MAVEGLPVQYDSLGNNIFDNGANALAYIQNNATNKVSKMVNDSGDITQAKLEDILDSSLDDSTKDYLVQYYLNEKSRKNAWNDQLEASNTQYQRTVADLQKAGLNPFLALQSLSGNTPSSSGQNVTGGLLTSSKNNKRDYQGNLMKVLALIAAAASRMLIKK